MEYDEDIQLELTRERTKELLERCVNGHWVSQDAPLVAAWLKQHQFVFDRLPELEQRTKFYSPYVTDKEPKLIINCDTSYTSAEDLKWLINSRILLAIGEKDYSTAKSYLYSALNLANSFQQESTVMNQLYASSLYRSMRIAFNEIVLHPKCTESDLELLDFYFDKKYKECDFNQMFHLHNRFYFLNSVCAMAEYGPDAFQGGPAVNIQPVSERNTVYYDQMLKYGNQMIDEYLTSLLPNPEKRFDYIAFEKKYFSAPAKQGTWDKVTGFLSKQARTKQTQDKLVQLVQTDMYVRNITIYNNEFYYGFYKILIALRRYHNQHGKYPLKLSELPPDIIAIIPTERSSIIK